MTHFEYDLESNETLLVEVLQADDVLYRRMEALRQYSAMRMQPANIYAGLSLPWSKYRDILNAAIYSDCQ